MQADPLGLVAGASVYGYANQSPMMYMDPRGENPLLVAIGLSIAFNVAVGYLTDYWLGDGCYTWDEVGRDAAIGAALGPLGLYGQTGRYGAGLGGLADDGLRGLADEICILRDAARGKGNFGLGTATTDDAARLGEDWVGRGYTVASDRRTLVSADGLRQYRPPSFKPNLDRTQANFEHRFQNFGPWQGNGHLDIFP